LRARRQAAALAAGGSLLGFLSAQVAFFARGDSFVRLWDATEYKELMLPLALVVYALIVNVRVRTEGLTRRVD